MTVTYENVIPTLIPNTVMQKKFFDGVFRVYVIAPAEGYVVHDKEGDWPDPDTDETILAFYRGGYTCGANYDFATTTVIDGYTAYGPREFFAKPESEVPADQIFGGVNNDHEVM